MVEQTKAVPVQRTEDITGKIELAEDTATLNEEFRKNVAIPYFKDIYKDLVAQSDSKSKGVNKVSLMNYSQLPGIIGERFFAAMDMNQTGYIDLKCFVRGFFKVYYSSVEDKMKLAFEIYDFDSDGYIDKEDVRLVMSHIPVDSAVKEEMNGEGRFTQENGGNMAFLDRIQTQQEIGLLLEEVYGSKKRLSFDEFKRVNMEDTSEMFLSIMLMLQTHLPCSENFFRYKQNYTKYVSGDGEGEKKEQPEGTVTEIASPKMLSRMAPIQNMARQQNINFNPVAMTHMLQGATSEKTEDLPEAGLKSIKQLREEKAARQAELMKMCADGTDTITEEGAVRLNNATKKGQAVQFSQGSGTANGSTPAQMIASPGAFLSGATMSPRLATFSLNEDQISTQIEGEMIRKATETRLKRYWYCLLGKELYVYKNKKEEKHKSMHSLVGVFVKDEVEEQLDATTVLYPFKLIFPPNKARTYYLRNKEDKDNWVEAIKKVIGYSSLFDFYEIKETLGKGKFGLVKTGIHKKTGKKVAVKVMSKKEMSVQDVELQRREIEILKMCQHPHIIRLLDLFENQDYIYIVMENLTGGDLFNYLERRDFSITEERSKELSHQLATALFYLHSFGIAHRDLKPENILMASDSDTADLKIVDFGLSKIIGPNESSLDPFGTLSYVAPEVLLQKPYGKEVDLWSLGVISYLMLSRVLPFDDEDDKEIARQTIQDAPEFNFDPWQDISKEAIDVCTALLDKNRHKRPTLEQTLNMPWFQSLKVAESSALGKFKSYALTKKSAEVVQKDEQEQREAMLKEQAE